MARLFGTDGIRGLANHELTAELALGIGVAAAQVLPDVELLAGRHPVAIVGRDSRASGEFLEAAIVAGLASAGVDVRRVGVIPTPGVAFLVDEEKADFGVVISASHNPMPDNGIKFFARGGWKLDDRLEDAIEARIGQPWTRPIGTGVGRVVDDVTAFDSYLNHLVSDIPHRLDGLSVVVDCANGAASYVSPEALRRAGATVIAIAVEPDGTNINDGCGSTHLSKLQAEVRAARADLGIAHDGDADRALAVDADGNIVDGDAILAILAIAMKESGTLTDSTVVATVMSNLGFHNAMREHDIKVKTTAVGDRYILDALREQGYNLGGEQSGHVILSDLAKTGDGVLTALHLMSRMSSSGKSLSELASVVKVLPQVLVNVPNVDKHRLAENSQVALVVSSVTAELGNQGRVLLRASGTEPLIRVMVEAQTLNLAQSSADRIAQAVREHLS
ncbi:MAG TPA: phosphoglucosamine mutase [Candidatus Nanopelagicaceae bacterium]|nr:phosphoglucosamine mutase [Candidatus Nanopelagicaceae bacterium]